jgi:biotin transport system substrate-specific component
MLKTLTIPVTMPTWLKVLGASLLIAIFARISIPLPFSPVPLVLQSHLCLLLGALLGPRLGALAVLAYLIEGALGLPVFSLGRSGMGMILGPTGGYLLGYLAGAWVCGYMIERWPFKKFLALALGNLAIFCCGLPQLSLFVGIEKAFLVGMLPFLAGDCVKLILTCRVLKASERRLV